MDELKQLEALGLPMPSPAYLFGAIIFSLIGYAAFRYARKKSLTRLKWLGVVMMFYSYAVSSTVTLYLVGLLLCAALYVWRNE